MRLGELSEQENFGRGEFVAMIANLRAVAVTVAPTLLGVAYAWGSNEAGSKGFLRRPGLGFWAAGLFALASEAVHQSIL